VNTPFGRDAGVELNEYFKRDVQPCERAWRFREKGSSRAVVLTKDGVGRDVAAVEILFERAAYEVAVLTAVKRLVGRQTQPL
jgi:hypothetical protein